MEPDDKKEFVLHPNTVWIKANHAKYAGNYVALKDGEFVASGKTIKEANEKARSLGVENPFLHRIIGENEEAWDGGMERIDSWFAESDKFNSVV